MFKSRSYVSTLTIASVLLLSGGAVAVNAATLNPATKWSATMVEGQSAGAGYCTLTRKFDDDIIVTIGQSAMSEFSLALDFRKKTLDMNKAYTIDLEPAPGEKRSYDMMPTSKSAIVVRLGYDDSFIRAVKQSNAIKTKIDGKDYNFKVTDMDKGQSELNKCMAGLTGEAPVQVAAKSPTKSPAKSSAKKIAEAIQKPVSAVKEVTKKALAIPPAIVEKSSVVATAPEPKSVKPLNIEDMDQPVQEQVKPIKIARTDSQTSTPVIKTAPAKEVVVAKSRNVEDAMPAVSALKVEAEAVETKIVQAQKKIEPVEVKITKTKKTDLTSPPKAEDRKEIVVSNKDTKQPQKAVRISRSPDLDDTKAPVKVAAAGRKLSPTEFDNTFKVKSVENKNIEDKRNAIKIVNKDETIEPVKKEVKIAKPIEKPEPKNMPKPEVVKVAEVKIPKADVPKLEPVKKVEAIKPVPKKEIPKVKVEKGELKLSEAELNAPKPFSSSESKKKDVKEQPKAVELKKEVRPPSDKILPTPKISKPDVQLVETKPAQKIEPVVDRVAKAKTEKELQEIRQQLSALEQENRTLFREAKEARGQIDTAVVNTSNEALKKMREYEQRLAAARADNVAMAREVEEMRRLQEDAELSAASKDPNLQRSIARYNESQREIKRLGLLLEQQKLSHRQEKTELEQMLFDPAVTNEVQRTKLAELEKKLAAAQAKLDAESKRVESVNIDKQNKLKEMERKLTAAKLKEKQLQAEELKLKAEAQKVQAAQAKLTALTVKEQLLKDKEIRLRKEQEQVKAKLQNVADAENKIAQAQLKAQEVKAKEAKLKMEAQKIAQAEAKIAQAREKEQRIAAQQKALEQKSQLLAQAEAKMAQAQIQVQAQELEEKQRSLQARSQAMASAEARLAELKQKELALAAKERELQRRAAERVTPPAVIPSQNSLSQPQKSYGRINPPATPSEPVRRQASSSLMSQSSLQNVLNNSGIAGVSSLAQQAPNLFVWRANGLNGRAEMASSGSASNLSQFAQSYISRERKSCSGDFASLPSSALSGAKTGYEVACVSPNGSGKAVSIVFVQRDNGYMAVSHETSAANMDAAMDARDKIANFL